MVSHNLINVEVCHFCTDLHVISLTVGAYLSKKVQTKLTWLWNPQEKGLLAIFWRRRFL